MKCTKENVPVWRDRIKVELDEDEIEFVKDAVIEPKPVVGMHSFTVSTKNYLHMEFIRGLLLDIISAANEDANEIEF